MDKTFAQEVWDKLSKTDVTDHVKQLPKSNSRPAIDYLPWHSAWLLLKREYPASVYRHEPDVHHLSESIEVEVKVLIRGEGHTGPDEIETSARLAVMSNRFAAIVSPDAREINDARQRCLVKALAFAGLGLQLWSDSIIPVGKLADPINAKQVTKIKLLLKETGVDEKPFLEWLSCESIETIRKENYERAIKQLEKTK